MTNADTLLALFKEQLENESERIATAYSLTKRGDRLIWWYFSRIVGLQPTEIDSIVCDGFNDLGIDAIRIDDDNVVHFYQFKNPESRAAGYAGGDIDKIISGLHLILSRRHESIANPELRGRIDEVHQSVRDGYWLHIVTSGGGIAAESQEKLKTFVDQLNAPSDTFFQWQVEDLRTLQDTFYRKHLPTLDQPISIDLEQTPYLVRSANHDSYIFHANGETLARLYVQHGEQLLQQNIRVYQGDNATNALIRETATGDQSASFFHYNNGVTFLCESGQWDGFTRKLTLAKAQVVNGGQTIRVLAGAFDSGSLKRDVLVPVRVITSQGDKSFASDVAVNLNNQNRIDPSFLRSNHPAIVQLASSLASAGWYLERREDESELLTPAERQAIENKIGRALDGHIIRLKEGAQAYVATYLRQPELAKKNPKRIFLGAQDGGHFERVFNHELTAEKFIVAQQLAWAIDEFVKQFMARKRRKDRVPDWKAEYKALLGETLVGKHSDVIDQVVPQSAVFMTGILFDESTATGRSLPDVVAQIAGGDYTLINQHLEQVIDLVKQDARFSKSWPTLLKSQSFFDQYTLFLKGKRAGLAGLIHAVPATSAAGDTGT